MATTYWKPSTVAVAQVGTIEVTAYDSATTYTVTIGGVAVSVAGVTDAAGTASALQAALAASTHPYFAAITWTVDSAVITATADVAGVPFTATPSVSGGTGTIGAYSATTAATGPNHWDAAGNWSGGAVPVADDDVIISDGSTNICWGFAQSAVCLNSLKIDLTYTGKIGLDRTKFAESSDGATTDNDYPEYRDTYLAIGTDALDIGDSIGSANAAGSTRIMLDLGTDASQVTIRSTATSSADTGRPAIRIIANSSSTDILVRGTRQGGVGIAADAPDETTTIGDVVVTATDTVTRVETGHGVTITNWEQHGGENVLRAAATVTAVSGMGGTLSLNGAYLVTTLNVYEGGEVIASNAPAAGAAITTANVYGKLDGSQSGSARTWTTVNLEPNGEILRNSTVTMTTLALDAAISSISAA